MKVVAVIPARFASTRFPGKPLVDICGKPMIWWVYQNASAVEEIDEVYVATESDKIVDECRKLKMNVMLTSDKHQTGTDRVGEVAQKIRADLYINIQGDEPMIEPRTIRRAIEPFFNNPELEVSNLMTVISDPVDLINSTVPKVITNQDNIGMYLSRGATPYPKGKLDYFYYKQVCVYGFRPKALRFFCKSSRGKIESIEDIEILRFIENGYKVQYIEVNTNTVAVDTPKDLEKVRQIMGEMKITKGDTNG